MSITKKTKSDVTIGDASALERRGICKRVEVKLLKLTIVVDFLAAELGKMDVILGMQWLCTTRFMRVHWPSMIMAFMANNTPIILRGDPSLTKAICSLKTLTKTWDEEDQGDRPPIILQHSRRGKKGSARVEGEGNTEVLGN